MVSDDPPLGNHAAYLLMFVRLGWVTSAWRSTKVEEQQRGRIEDAARLERSLESVSRPYELVRLVRDDKSSTFSSRIRFLPSMQRLRHSCS